MPTSDERWPSESMRISGGPKSVPISDERWPSESMRISDGDGGLKSMRADARRIADATPSALLVSLDSCLVDVGANENKKQSHSAWTRDELR